MPRLPTWLSPRVILAFVALQVIGNWLVAAFAFGAGILAGLLGALAVNVPWFLAPIVFLGVLLIVTPIVAILVRAIIPMKFLAAPERHDELASEPDSNRTYFKGESVRIADLATSRILDGKIFEECEIEGPAVLASLAGTVISEARLDGGGEPLGATVWIIDANQPVGLGAVPMTNCIFRKCRFSRISFVMTQEIFDEAKGAFQMTVTVPIPSITGEDLQVVDTEENPPE